jgi:putative two-component system response regulator
MGCTSAEALTYAKASRLHDVGKVGIPDHILRKPGPLTDGEFAEIQRHTLIGDAVLKRSPSLVMARLVARSHHEKWNGSGYPDGRAGDAIPFVARLVAVVDVFDALVSVRPYKGAWQKAAALSEIRQGSGKHFDPAIADTFVALIEKGEMDDLIEAAILGSTDLAMDQTHQVIASTLGH